MTTPADPTRVLLIDDDALIHPLVAHMLAPLAVEVTAVLTAADGLAACRRVPPEIILLDHDLPDARGEEVLQSLRSDPATRDIPVLMITGSDSTDVLSACFAAGARDYLRKPFAALELRARVGLAIERQRLLAQMTNAAQRDRLTGLANRALLSARLELAVQRRAEGTGPEFALLFLDFDRFKLINDTLGHDVGDELLKAIAGRLRGNLRSTTADAPDARGTTIARLGGDEFVVLVEPAAHLGEGVAVAERLLRVLEPPYRLSAHTVRSSASIGITHSARHYASAEAMLRDADIAMYEAKARGRGGYVVFSDDMRAAVQKQHALEQRIRAAVEAERIELAWSPVVRLADRAVIAADVTSVWTALTDADPALAVDPETLRAVTADAPLARAIDRLTVDAALRALADSRRDAADVAPAGDRPGVPPAAAPWLRAVHRISLEPGLASLSDRQFVRELAAACHDLGVPTGDVEIRVSEQVLHPSSRHAAEVRATMRELQSAGIRIALDEFGAGLGSLVGVHEAGVDAVRLAPSLVRRAGRDRRLAAIVHATVTLAHNLELPLVAAGIDHVDDLALLLSLGCEVGCGALCREPASAIAERPDHHTRNAA